ncbi:hypothetical protein [Croceibacterium ferulae]|uniref:hypothetical protein n=1 Tax=Croceibacterium ferulae TaxID=1854641 RepID=UPI000EB4416A|nr:hypothetical protein [Croceibacterium ferulae]
MNAFDAATGDTGLANLFASLGTPASGQGAQTAMQGTTPFAQLLDQLNALPMPQAEGPALSLARVMPEGVPPAAMVPLGPLAPSVQQLCQSAGEPIPAEHAPARVAAWGGGLRLPVIGKMLPPVATGGTILPAGSVVEAAPGEEPDVVTELPVADMLAEAAHEDSVPPVQPAAVQLLTTALPPMSVTASAVPLRPAGAAAAWVHQRSVSGSGTLDLAAPTTPAVPAVTLTAADASVVHASDMPAMAEHAPKEVAVLAGSPRPTMPVTADLHSAASPADPVASAPQLRPEPQQLAMQDLTQIVERLAAAREAAAPAATQLAVEHAEFGPLSLSIQQGDRGELAIAVTAADRDNQAALVAAIAQAEAPGFEQAPERRGSESAQRDPAGAGQQGEQRGQGGAQRDRFAGQQQRHAMPHREPARERGGETRSGTYA